MLSEIGSNFWINEKELLLSKKKLSVAEFNLFGDDVCWLSTGRSAIGYVLDDIQLNKPNTTKKAILPSFTCDTVIKPFVERGYEIFYIDVDRYLQINLIELSNIMLNIKDGVLLLHRYFGFDTLSEIEKIVNLAKKNSVTFIEDCTQSLYSKTNKANANYYVGSIRKWCGVPDGGFAVKTRGTFTEKPIETDVVLEKEKLEASLLKHKYMVNGIGEKQAFLIKYREAEETLDNQNKYYSISNSSRIIQSNLDIETLKNKRRRNYDVLVSSLHVPVVFSKTVENIVPLYCPIYVDNRAELQTYLRDKSIFAPILWPRYEGIPDMFSRELYEHLLCLPIDQRYGEDDISRMALCINNYMEA